MSGWPFRLADAHDYLREQEAKVGPLREAAKAITDMHASGGHGDAPWLRLYFTTPGEELAFLAALTVFRSKP